MSGGHRFASVPRGRTGSFYVEVVDYGNGFRPVWLQAGGEETDIKVSCVAFGK